MKRSTFYLLSTCRQNKLFGRKSTKRAKKQSLPFTIFADSNAIDGQTLTLNDLDLMTLDRAFKELSNGINTRLICIKMAEKCAFNRLFPFDESKGNVGETRDRSSGQSGPIRFESFPLFNRNQIG